MAGDRPKTMRTSGHIFTIIIMQSIIVLLFALFARWSRKYLVGDKTKSYRYDPKTAQKSAHSVEAGSAKIRDTYPSKIKQPICSSSKNVIFTVFQDVHVMIFLGIGFLMTFLRKYSLSAVSLNLLCAALVIEVFILVSGFFHLQCETPEVSLLWCKLLKRTWIWSGWLFLPQLHE